MNTKVEEAMGSAAPGRGDTNDNRQEMVTDIVRSLDRVHNGKLNGVKRLVNSPLSRVFTPRSLHGMALFNRLVTIDAVFSRCEQEVMRRANSMQAFDDKMGLERRMFELNAALVEFGAEMAIDYKVEEVPRDVAILAAMKRIKQERKQVDQQEQRQQQQRQQDRQRQQRKPPKASKPAGEGRAAEAAGPAPTDEPAASRPVTMPEPVHEPDATLASAGEPEQHAAADPCGIVVSEH